MSDWWSLAAARLERLAVEEYRRQRAAWVNTGRSPKSFRYAVPDWQRDVIDALGRNDENDVKGLLIRLA